MKRHMFAFTLVLAWLAIAAPQGAAQREDAGDRVVLVTIDGARTEEIFGGLDVAVLRSTLKEGQQIDESAAYRRFWAPSREERRRKLMPFFWSLVSDRGSIAGDGQVGSSVRLANRHWFSYPGYAEILLGQPHDQTIASNDPNRNPHSTVLERLRAELQLAPEKVATFASWGVFNEIVEHSEGATLVNAGVEVSSGDDEELRLLHALQAETPTPWDNTRFDAYTFRLAMRHLERARPRVLYIAFDETDDWAHDGRYERVLDAFARTDGYLKQLWVWLQNQPDYRGRTHLLITTDHGRGHTAADWRDHGARIKGSEETWIAFASPRMTQRGPWRDHAPLSTSQVAATLASWLGVDWRATNPAAGAPIR